MTQQNADQLHRYLFEQRHARGELVQLHATYARLLEGHDYPKSVAQLLGEALAATCLLTATLKFEGEITLQIQGDGPMSLLVINGRDNQTMRGIARVQSEVAENASFTNLIGKGQMVITIMPDQGERYQGVVAVESSTLTGCIEQYFIRSEQLPSSLQLFADPSLGSCGGMLIQSLPGEHDAQSTDFGHLSALAQTLKSEEVYELSAEQLLFRLFHEEKVRIYEPQQVAFKCSCSRERCRNALVSMGQEELGKLFAEQEEVDMHCQYCNSHHVFHSGDMAELFGQAGNTLH